MMGRAHAITRPIAVVGIAAVALLGALRAGHGAAPLAPLFHGGERPLQTGSTADSSTCAQCHQDIAREWASSQHRASWTDPVFTASYAIEPLAFCRHCHAPLSNEQRPSSIAASDGVSCVACHVRDGVVRSSGNGRGDAVGERSPHAVIADARFASSGHCAGCHQFNFPAERSLGGARFDSHVPMQDTFGEWNRSSFSAGNECQSCHMPWRTARDGARYRSHAFPGSRDPELLSRAARVDLTASREGASIVVRARVVGTGAGHAFPTGDLFRRLELRVWTDAAPAQTVAFAREFADVFERLPDGTMGLVRRQVADARVPPAGTGIPRENTLRFEDRSTATATVVRWKLEHLLMSSPLAASQGIGAALNRATVCEGVVTVQPLPLTTRPR